MVSIGSGNHGGFSRRLNPENEPVLYLRYFVVAQSQGDDVAGQQVVGQSPHELQAAAHYPASPTWQQLASFSAPMPVSEATSVVATLLAKRESLCSVIFLSPLLHILVKVAL